MKKICLIAIALFALNATPSFAQDNANKDPRQEAIAKTEKMTKELRLSEDQKKAVLEINMHQAVQARNGKLTEAQLVDMEKSSEVRYKTVLNEEQFKKYKAAKLKEAKSAKSQERANTDVTN